LIASNSAASGFTRPGSTLSMTNAVIMFKRYPFCDALTFTAR
jgi:hypothetical protein